MSRLLAGPLQAVILAAILTILLSLLAGCSSIDYAHERFTQAVETVNENKGSACASTEIVEWVESNGTAHTADKIAIKGSNASLQYVMIHKNVVVCPPTQEQAQ